MTLLGTRKQRLVWIFFSSVFWLSSCARDWWLFIKIMPTIKVMRRSKLDPSLFELYQINDKQLCKFVDSFKERISWGVQINISLEDDASSWLLWKSLCMGFHKLKDLQELEEKVFWLKKHLEVDNDEASVISSHFISCNYLVLSEKEIQTAIIHSQEN